jgi:hypothetical protein
MNRALDLPLKTLGFLFPDVPVDNMPTVARESFPWYNDYAKATIRLAEAHVRGVPFDRSMAERLRKELTNDINRAAHKLKGVPELAPFYATLVNPRAGETDELRSAVSTLSGNLGSPSRAEVDFFEQRPSELLLSSGPTVSASLQAIRINKARYLTICRYEGAAGSEGCMHSLLGFGAATGRAISSEPALQNIPKEQRFRSLIKARRGNLILSLDYAKAELVIASALADRAIADIRRRLDDSEINCWFMERVFVGANTEESLPSPSELDTFNVEWLNQAIPAVAQRVLRRPVQQMASVFAEGLDPHLVTALDMARRKGTVDYGRNLIEWLKSVSLEQQEELKLRLHDERKKAKPTNFGLLYGMGSKGLQATGIRDYGLSWTLDEARATREAWFAFYPEFRMWHWWTRFLQCRKVSQDMCMVWDSGTNKLISPEHEVKLFETTTLTGRPIAVLNDPRKAINYQAQGTGADILARAISMLPENIVRTLLLPVHDELVFEVPAVSAEEIKKLAIEIMMKAAADVIGGRVGVEVEACLGEAWGCGAS